jgi:hypothetical protein
MVGVLMSVGVMTVEVMSVGEITETTPKEHGVCFHSLSFCFHSLSFSQWGQTTVQIAPEK